MSFSKSWISSKLAVQCTRPRAVPSRPFSEIVLRRPSPRAVKSHTVPSSPPPRWQLAQLMYPSRLMRGSLAL